MKLRLSYPRASVSLVLAMAVISVFTLRSFASPDAVSAGDPNPPQNCTGSLTVASGKVSINGNPAQTGATVLTGSVLTTNSNGKAIIDLGALGRVEVGDSTTITLTCTAGLLEVRTNCSRTEVEVRQGTVDVKSPKVEQLSAGKKTEYDGDVDLTSTGADLKVECEGHRGGAYLTAGVWGLLALIGVGAAVAVGIGIDDESGAPPAVSPVR